MPAYILAQVTQTKPERYADYAAETPGLVAKYGGHFVVRGGNPLPLEGDWPEERYVLIAFPDREAALRFYRSEDYQAIVPIRQEASRGRLILLDGFEG